MRWKSVDLPIRNGNAMEFKIYLEGKRIPFQASASDNLIHFNILVKLNQIKEMDDFIKSL